MAPPSSADPAAGAAEKDDDVECETPILLVVGMAGSGKTTLVNSLALFLEDSDCPVLAEAEAVASSASQKAGNGSAAVAPAAAVDARNAADDEDDDEPPGAYVVNLDPAVVELPYEPNVDIRDTVKYKDVMREYTLGPNGAIITSLNLFATRFDQVLALVEKRAPESKAVVIDTPGQIESFTWSASGAIITESLASVLPTVILFVVDTPRSQAAMTFVSNMLYACSIMYKTRLPMVVVFNKIDVTSSKVVEAWLRDFDAFDSALKEENFAGTLARSIAQALEEFYGVMRCVSVSSVTEEGLEDLVKAVHEASAEYKRDYRPAMELKKAERAEEQRKERERQLASLQADLDSERAGPSAQVRDAAWAPAATLDPGVVTARSPLDPPARSTTGVGSQQLRTLKKDMRSTDEASHDDGEDVDPEDAQAYADFVKYLEALKCSPRTSE